MDIRTTTQGTPCSPAWDDGWLAVVEAAERLLGHRVCGARTIAGNPCPLPPNHANGRCKFHGGFDLTGAQPGNRNAVIHGLYSRALRPCDPTCPLWTKCPCADDAVKALPLPDRPACPYEALHYNAALTDALTRAPRNDDGDPHPIYLHLCHQIALLQTMLMRAASVLREQPLVDSVSASGDKYTMQSAKPSAYLQAFLRISCEHRSYLKLIEAHPLASLGNDQLREHDRRTHHDTDLEPQHQAEVEQTQSPAEIRARRLVQTGRSYIGGLREGVARRLFHEAQSLAPHIAETYLAEFEPAMADPDEPPPPDPTSSAKGRNDDG